MCYIAYIYIFAVVIASGPDPSNNLDSIFTKKYLSSVGDRRILRLERMTTLANQNSKPQFLTNKICIDWNSHVGSRK